MKTRRSLVLRGRRRYVLCRSPERPKARSTRRTRDRRPLLWLPAAAFVFVVLVCVFAGGQARLLPPGPLDGLPVASLGHYSFDDFANAQR